MLSSNTSQEDEVEGASLNAEWREGASKALKGQ